MAEQRLKSAVWCLKQILRVHALTFFSLCCSDVFFSRMLWFYSSQLVTFCRKQRDFLKLLSCARQMGWILDWIGCVNCNQLPSQHTSKFQLLLSLWRNNYLRMNKPKIDASSFKCVKLHFLSKTHSWYWQIRRSIICLRYKSGNGIPNSVRHFSAWCQTVSALGDAWFDKA